MPEPDSPTKATFCAPLTESVMPWSTIRSGRDGYANVTLSQRSSPSVRTATAPDSVLAVASSSVDSMTLSASMTVNACAPAERPAMMVLAGIAASETDETPMIAAKKHLGRRGGGRCAAAAARGGSGTAAPRDRPRRIEVGRKEGTAARRHSLRVAAKQRRT